jgi:hypothetical protein
LGFPLRIEGELPLFFRGIKPENGWGLLLNGGEHSQVAAYLLHLCSAALGHDGMWRGPAHVFIIDEDEIKISLLRNLEKDAAAGDLRIWLEAFSHRPDFDHLPLSLVDKILKSDPVKFEEIGDWPGLLEQKERDDAESGFGFQGYKTRVLRAVRPVVPADAAVKIGQRLLPFLRWKRSWTKVES